MSTGFQGASDLADWPRLDLADERALVFGREGVSVEKTDLGRLQKLDQLFGGLRGN